MKIRLFKNLFPIKSQKNSLIPIKEKAYEIKARLERQPFNDLFEKPKYMQTEEFWSDPENLMKYLRGQYLADGGCWDALPHTNAEFYHSFLGQTKFVVNENGRIVRIYEKLGGSKYPSAIYDVNPQTGKITAKAEVSNTNKVNQITLFDDNGHPTKSVFFSQSKDSPTIETYYVKNSDMPEMFVNIHPDGTISTSDTNGFFKIYANGQTESSIKTKSEHDTTKIDFKL